MGPVDESDNSESIQEIKQTPPLEKCETPKQLKEVDTFRELLDYNA